MTTYSIRETGRNLGRLASVLFAAVLIAVVPAFAATVTFQQGAGGYSSARDTFIQQDPANAGTNNAAAAALNWDGDDPGSTGYDVYTLLRFEGLIGSGAGQIPAGSVITSATLEYTVSDTGDAGDVREALADWLDTSSWSSFCGASCDQGIEFGATVASATAASAARLSVDVTASVQRWSDGTTNRGWIVVPTGTGGVDIRSAEYGTVSDRPLLRVIYNEGPPSSSLVRDPYLQLGTPTSMTVVWRTDVATNSRVLYGTTFGVYDQEAVNAASGTDHFVTVTDLTPGTRYFYTIGSTTTQQGGGTTEHYFVTSPVAGTATPFRAWIFGDSGICSPVQDQVRDSMLAYTGSDPPDLFLHAGDVVQVSGADDEYTDCHLAYYTTVLRHTPFWPAMGNHDSYSTTCQDPGLCTGPYFSTFVLPTLAEAGGVASNTEAYYSYDYANVHFIVLNGTNVSKATNGPMANWLRSDLAATTQQWVVAYWHQPPYTKGTHDSDTEADLIQMRANIIPILELAGVDLVLNGHSHGYERSYLIDGTYTNPTPTFSTLLSNGNIVDDGDGQNTGDGPYLKSPGKHPHEGTVYVVTATGAMGPGGAHNHPVMHYSESANGSTLIDVDGNILTVTFLRSDGVVRDTFSIVKGDLPPQVSSVNPAKGSVLSALPSVEVTFTMDVTGVDASDLTVDGFVATAVTPVSASVYRFTGYLPPGEGAVAVQLQAGGIASVANPANVFTGNSWNYTIDTTPPRVAIVTPARGSLIGALPNVVVTFTKPVTGVTGGGLVVGGSPAASLSGVAGTAGPYVFSGYANPGDGLVDVTLAAGSIQDADGRPFAGDAWTYKLTRRLVINEFLASNNTAATDENGEFDDYVEIYNPTSTTVDMSGMFLTDDLDSPAQYRIPNGVTVPPKGYIVFWCDSTPSQGSTHTSFNILRAGEDLGLYDTEANGLAPIDTMTFSTQTTDVSFGRFPDGIDGFVSMRVTPGAANTISCNSDPECTALTDACNVGRCVSNECVAEAANEGGPCDDGIDCRGPDTCAAGVCNGGADLCGAGQACNLGTGVCEVIPTDPLPILVGEAWRYFKGTAEPTPSDLTAWTQVAFDDTAWLSGASGFGYGPDCTSQTGTTLSDMLNTYRSLYIRKPFQVDTPSRVLSLSLTVDYDDAWVAYLNGVEVARSAGAGGTAGTPLAFDADITTTNRECSNGSPLNLPDVIDLTSQVSLLTSGTNVIAIHGLNVSNTSSDFVLIPSLTSVESSGCLSNSECDDGNPCTDDLCNISVGTCSHTNDNTNGCSDGIACTSDACSAGACVSTDVCTGGSVCNPATGTCESGQSLTKTFQQGAGGYAGVVDTFIDTALGSQAGATPIVVDGSPEEQVLLRFDGIFGTGAGQIPIGSTITSATLTLRVGSGTNDQCANPVNYHRLLHAWVVTDVWSVYGLPPWNATAGIQADGVEAQATAEATATMSTASTAYPVSVTGSVQAWALDPSTNFGWAILPTNTDGLRLESSESATVSYRPLLSVTYVPPLAGCTTNEQCDDGLWCNGAETCNLGASTCVAGTAPNCGDAVACTTDACNEATDACTHTPNAAVCSDGNVCTDDSCDVALGCLHPSNTASCSDGNACTTGDVCSGGACTGGGATNCDDGVACTTDGCDTALGCSHVSNCTGGQTCNLTSGVCETPSAAPLPIAIGGTWAYFKGLSEPTLGDLTAWTRIGFDDSAWLSGPSGLGFDYYVETGGTNGNGDYGPFVGTELGDMRGCTPTNPPLCNAPGYLSVYMRKEFTVANPAAVTSLTFRMYADDGYVAYLNGTEVARLRVTGTPPAYNTLASGGPSVAPPVEQTLDLTSAKGLLVTGINVLAVQGHNATLDSRDLLLIPQLSSTQGCTTNAQCDDGNPCTDDACNIGAGLCTNTNDDTNSCTDNIACTSDACFAGACVGSSNCPTGQTCNGSTGLCEATSVSLVFQNVSGGYAGTVDTFLVKGTPGLDNSAAQTLVVDGDPDADIRQILLRFDGLFASGGGPIPAGSTILSATLTVHITNGSLDGARLHRMVVPWPETATWTSFVAGVQTDGTEAETAYDASGAHNTPLPAFYDLDVTSSVAAWAGGVANHGWVFVTPPAGTDSWQFDSSEATTESQRPKLTVQYRGPSGPQGRMTCALSSPTASPGGTIGLDVFLENLGSLPGIRGYQTQLSITRTSGSGTLVVPCPGGVTIDDSRPDHLYYGRSDDYPTVNCAQRRAASALLMGSVVVDATPDHLASYLLAVSSDAAPGSTFEIALAPYPDSILADENSDPIEFTAGAACVATVGSCVSAAQCDDGNPCTDDACNAGVCVNTVDAANTCDDGSVCTTGDHCNAAGLCEGGSPLACNDGNACTSDSCDSGTGGCVFDPTPGVACDDGNACTTGEQCNASGLCSGGSPQVCDDGNVCTSDSCDSGSGGCVFTPTPGTACDDGNACTTGDACTAGGACSGSLVTCDDGDVCTSDVCSGGACLHAPNGSCGISGTVRYYRDGATSVEPSVKGTPAVGIDRTQDTVPEAVTGGTGGYAFGNLAGSLSVSTTPKLGSPRASDHNGAVTSFDASLIARHSVGLMTLSANQQIAGDVTGNGAVGSYDAAQVAQFAVQQIDHFEVAVATGSDWRFLRCDHYVSATVQDCGAPVYAHAPLGGSRVDDFYAVLYGEVSGNWEPVTGFAAASDAESKALANDQALAASLRSSAPVRITRDAAAGPAVLRLTGGPLQLAPGERATFTLDLRAADGIEAIDLELVYDPTRLTIVEAGKGRLAAGLELTQHDTGGDLRAGLWGVQALTGSGELLVITVEARGAIRGEIPIEVRALANEGRIPLRAPAFRGPGRPTPSVVPPTESGLNGPGD
jgi:hypothetical protein